MVNKDKMQANLCLVDEQRNKINNLKNKMSKREKMCFKSSQVLLPFSLLRGFLHVMTKRLEVAACS